MVCADDQMVHGMQLEMRVHDPQEFEHAKEFDNKAFQLLEQGTTQFVFGDIDIGDLFRLDVIGNPLSPCQYLEMDYTDRIVYIDAYTDGQYLRKLKVGLQNNGKFAEFGDFDFGDTEPILMHHEFYDAEILGIIGTMATRPDDEDMTHFVDLGFIVNSCPIRDLAGWEARQIRENILKNPRVQKTVIGWVLIIVVLLVIFFMVTYFCLKNRG